MGTVEQAPDYTPSVVGVAECGACYRRRQAVRATIDDLENGAWRDLLGYVTRRRVCYCPHICIEWSVAAAQVQC